LQEGGTIAIEVPQAHRERNAEPNVFRRTQESRQSIGLNIAPRERIASSIDLLPFGEPVARAGPVEIPAAGFPNRSSLLSRHAEIASIRFSVSTGAFTTSSITCSCDPPIFQIRVVRQVFVCARNALRTLAPNLRIRVVRHVFCCVRNALPSMAPNLRFSRRLSLAGGAHRILDLSSLISILDLPVSPQVGQAFSLTFAFDIPRAHAPRGHGASTLRVPPLRPPVGQRVDARRLPDISRSGFQPDVSLVCACSESRAPETQRSDACRMPLPR
jgi:hypothetical protein